MTVIVDYCSTERDTSVVQKKAVTKVLKALEGCSGLCINPSFPTP